MCGQGLPVAEIQIWCAAQGNVDGDSGRRISEGARLGASSVRQIALCGRSHGQQSKEAKGHNQPIIPKVRIHTLLLTHPVECDRKLPWGYLKEEAGELMPDRRPDEDFASWHIVRSPRFSAIFDLSFCTNCAEAFQIASFFFSGGFYGVGDASGTLMVGLSIRIFLAAATQLAEALRMIDHRRVGREVVGLIFRRGAACGLLLCLVSRENLSGVGGDAETRTGEAAATYSFPGSIPLPSR